MLKNFPPQVWRSVSQQLNKRKRDGKNESEVVHNGVPLPAKKVQKAIARYCLPRLARVDETTPVRKY